MNHGLAGGGHAVRAEAALHRFIGPPLPLAFAELLGEPVDPAELPAAVRPR